MSKDFEVALDEYRIALWHHRWIMMELCKPVSPEVRAYLEGAEAESEKALTAAAAKAKSFDPDPDFTARTVRAVLADQNLQHYLAHH